LQNIIQSLSDNLQFVSELLQADIRLFVRGDDGQIYIHSYFHPNQDSIYLGPKFSDPKKGERLKPYKDISVDKAFRLGKKIVGQYGLVINNRRIQEFAYPIFSTDDEKQSIAVIAVERDIYVTRNILGQHWDLIADNLIKALKQKIKDVTRFPQIAFGEGALILRDQLIFFANPLAVNLLSEIAEHSKQFVNRSLEDLFAGFPRQYKGQDRSLSIESIEEVSLRQRNIIIRRLKLVDDFSVLLIKDNSEIKIKETLLKEIHHRVKNNLQTVISLLRLQMRRNPDLEDAFMEAINRANSIALVHEHLSHSNNIESIDFGYLVQKILKGLISSYGAENLIVDFDCPNKVFIFSDDATNLALVLNEILSNTLEHTAGRLSKISVKLYYNEDDLLHMIVQDDGGGFEQGFDYKKSTGLGWGIVRTITEESLRGKLTVENYDSDQAKGVKVHLIIPAKASYC
jgi:two-component sensor histidine kinase